MTEINLDELNQNVHKIASAITPCSAAPGHDETGGTVCSVTESIMGVTAGLCRIAEAIHDLAEALRESNQ